MSESVPTTEEVRDNYTWGVSTCGCCAEYRDEDFEKFDRWKARNDAEVAAKALEEAADLAEGVESIVLDPVMEKIGKNVGLSLAQEFRARAAEYRKAVQS